MMHSPAATTRAHAHARVLNRRAVWLTSQGACIASSTASRCGIGTPLWYTPWSMPSLRSISLICAYMCGGTSWEWVAGQQSRACSPAPWLSCWSIRLHALPFRVWHLVLPTTCLPFQSVAPRASDYLPSLAECGTSCFRLPAFPFRVWHLVLPTTCPPLQSVAPRALGQNALSFRAPCSLTARHSNRLTPWIPPPSKDVHDLKPGR
eukprot:365350-Chlamydomonas_euryale.AAC.11